MSTSGMWSSQTKRKRKTSYWFWGEMTIDNEDIFEMDEENQPSQKGISCDRKISLLLTFFSSFKRRIVSRARAKSNKWLPFKRTTTALGVKLHNTITRSLLFLFFSVFLIVDVPQSRITSKKPAARILRSHSRLLLFRSYARWSKRAKVQTT